MELSDNDKDQILTTKEKIRNLTSEISILLENPHRNRNEILEKMSHIIGYISDLCIISNHLNCVPDLHAFRLDYWHIQEMFEAEGMRNILRNSIERFCSRANSVTLTEKKIGLFSRIKIRIENFNIIKNIFGK